MRDLIYPKELRLVSGSSQKIAIARTADNDLTGLDQVTMVIGTTIEAIIAAAAIFNAPTDGTQEVIGLKNNNSAQNTLRANIRAGGSSNNFDIAAPGGTYRPGKGIRLGIRYDGANVSIMVNGVVVMTQAKTGVFGTLTGDYMINAVGAGTSGYNTQRPFMFKVWKEALDDAAFNAAMMSQFNDGACIDLDFSDGVLPVDRAHHALVTLSNTPVFQNKEFRQLVS